MRLEITLLGLILGLSLTQAAQAENVYKWVDKDGKVHFGDRPQAEEAQELKVTDKSVPVRASSRYNPNDEDADVDEASTGATSGQKVPGKKGLPVSKSQIIGYWKDTTDLDVDERFSGDGMYVGSTSFLGIKMEIHGNWTLEGDRLVIKANKSTATTKDGKTQTKPKNDVDDRKIISFEGKTLTYESKGKQGTMTKKG